MTENAFMKVRREKATSPFHLRWRRFKNNRRGYYSLILFSILFVLSLFSEFISNDKPFLVTYKGELYYPLFVTYPETTFGGDFETETEYTDPFFMELLQKILLHCIPGQQDTFSREDMQWIQNR